MSIFKKRFKVGDRVIYIGELGVGNAYLKKCSGIIRCFNNTCKTVGVEWDENIDGHNLANSISGNKGWYVEIDKLKIDKVTNWRERFQK